MEMMDTMVNDEFARINARDVMSEFELSVLSDLTAWTAENVKHDPGLKYSDSQYSTQMFWNERLN
jgi:hypothetical protein